MVLLIADQASGGQSPLKTAIEVGLKSEGIGVVTATPDDDDLFGRALGHQAIVYLAAAELLSGNLSPAPIAVRMQKVLAASSAPGVTLVVAVFPEQPEYLVELRELRSYGKPYVGLEAPPLAEEVAQTLPARGTLWLPRTQPRRITTSARVLKSILEGLDTEEQGRITSAPAESVDAVTLFRRAAAARGNVVKIRAVPGWFYRWLRPWFRWRYGVEFPALNTAEALFPVEMGARPRPALEAGPRAAQES